MRVVVGSGVGWGSKVLLVHGEGTHTKSGMGIGTDLQPTQHPVCLLGKLCNAGTLQAV